MSDAPAGDAGPDVAALVADHLRDVPDFPSPGIVFKDIAPLLATSAAFNGAVDALAELAGEADLIAGVEARGFLLAGAIAARRGSGLVPIRKAGKLPPPTITRAYVLEYGTATIEVPVGVLAGRSVFLVDDVLATGGTLRAAADLVAEAGGRVTAVGVLLELGFLGGRAALGQTAALTALLRI
jgi:adenine phosphoribosyltransferase